MSASGMPMPVSLMAIFTWLRVREQLHLDAAPVTGELHRI
jgi:hypothetical protein